MGAKMRLEKLSDLLDLARQLSGSAEGFTLDEIAETFHVGRRTAERMRDAVEQSFGPLEVLDDGRKKRFRISARGLSSFAITPTSEELADLENAARGLEIGGDLARAQNLRRLGSKIKSNLKDSDRRRLSTDLEAMLRSEGFARQVGPKPMVDAEVFRSIRTALLSQRIIDFSYKAEGSKVKRNRVVPYGILFAPKYYLIARLLVKSDPVLFRLDRLFDVAISDEYGAPPETFDIEDYASRSFGVFQEEPQDVLLQFRKEVSDEVITFLFHPHQKVIVNDDGTVNVSFRAGGFLQMAHHLMTWGTNVKILKPKKLKEMIGKEVALLYKHHQ